MSREAGIWESLTYVQCPESLLRPLCVNTATNEYTPVGRVPSHFSELALARAASAASAAAAVAAASIASAVSGTAAASASTISASAAEDEPSPTLRFFSAVASSPDPAFIASNSLSASSFVPAAPLPLPSNFPCASLSFADASISSASSLSLRAGSNSCDWERKVSVFRAMLRE